MQTATLPDTPAVVDVLLANRARFRAFLERRLHDPVAAEEVLQEAFVKGVERHDTLRDGDAAVAWFYRILRNAIADHYRRRRPTEELDADALPADEEIHEVVCACVGGLLETLKPDYADILRAVELEGVQVKEYAERHGLTANNAGVRVFRARKALLGQVQRACGACATHGCIDCTCAPAP